MLDLVHTDIYENDELKHWGILGMHWGIRRYQNPDGSLTPEGRERYLKSGNGRKKYFDDNWKKATKDAEAYIKANPEMQKFMNRSYYEYDKETGEQIDYYTIIWEKADKFLSEQYDKLVESDHENNTYYSAKKPEDLKSNQIYVNDTGMVYTTRPITKEDISVDPELKKLMKLFNVKDDDLVIDKNNKSNLASIFRKDGKPFVFKYKNDDYKYTNQDLRYIEWEDEWFSDYFKPVK